MSLILVAVIGIALGVLYRSFVHSPRKESWNSLESILQIPSTVQLGLPNVSVPSPAEVPAKKKDVSKAPRETDLLLQYKRRYGLYGRFTRRVRRIRQQAARRALENAIRNHDVDRLQIFHAIGIR